MKTLYVSDVKLSWGGVDITYMLCQTKPITTTIYCEEKDPTTEDVIAFVGDGQLNEEQIAALKLAIKRIEI